MKKCCEILNARLAPLREKLKNPSWKDLVAAAFAQGGDLTARNWYYLRPIFHSCYSQVYYPAFTIFSTHSMISVSGSLVVNAQAYRGPYLRQKQVQLLTFPHLSPQQDGAKCIYIIYQP